MMYRIVAFVIFHTTDEYCLSEDVETQIPVFFVDAPSAYEAQATALKIICPVDLQYESVTVGFRNVEEEVK